MSNSPFLLILAWANCRDEPAGMGADHYGKAHETDVRLHVHIHRSRYLSLTTNLSFLYLVSQ